MNNIVTIIVIILGFVVLNNKGIPKLFQNNKEFLQGVLAAALASTVLNIQVEGLPATNPTTADDIAAAAAAAVRAAECEAASGECEPCADGFHSANGYNEPEACASCSECEPGETVTTPCGKTSDTVCETITSSSCADHVCTDRTKTPKKGATYSSLEEPDSKCCVTNAKQACSDWFNYEDEPWGGCGWLQEPEPSGFYEPSSEEPEDVCCNTPWWRIVMFMIFALLIGFIPFFLAKCCDVYLETGAIFALAVMAVFQTGAWYKKVYGSGYSAWIMWMVFAAAVIFQFFDPDFFKIKSKNFGLHATRLGADRDADIESARAAIPAIADARKVRKDLAAARMNYAGTELAPPQSGLAGGRGKKKSKKSKK